jgi:SAM-dependent methyltransferase
MHKPTLHCACSNQYCCPAFQYNNSPQGETKYNLLSQQYQRGYQKCELCGHWFADMSLDLSGLYQGDYVESTYGNKLRQVFNKVISLPACRSDNAGRVNRIQAFAKDWFNEIRLSSSPRKLLDIGSGLGVFPYVMQQHGWECTAIDPDPRSIEHIRHSLQLNAIQGDFIEHDWPSDINENFDVITFNKVLEHVNDPVNMLSKASQFLASDGFVYIELPDATQAATQGQDREEFFIDHLHVFSFQSTVLLIEKSGFQPRLIERLQEPSSKYTIRAFLSPSV